MAEHAGDKTFEATPHRRQEAREKGHVAFSQDLGSAATLMLAILLLMLLGGAVVASCASLMRGQLGHVPELVTDQDTLLREWLGIALGIGAVTLPILGLMALGSILTSILQVGILWVPERLAPDWSRLSPLAGLKRIFSLTGTMRLGFGLVKVIVVSIVAVTVLWQRWDDVLRASGLDTAPLARFFIDISQETMLWT